jgi:hypothetical protein
MTNEGGSVAEEWRLEGVADRVNTFGTAFLGLTVECARCHDHKYDPITQRDYYALSAFFNSIDEYGLYDQADIVPTPSLLLPTPEQERDLEAARAAVALAEQALAQARAEAEPRFRAWMGSRTNEGMREWENGGSRAGLPFSHSPIPPLLPDLTGQFDFERFDGTTLPNLAPGATQHGARQDEVPLVAGHSGKAAQLDGENNVNFPQLGRFTRHTPFTLSFWMWDPRTAAEPAVVFQASSGTDTGPHGYDLLLERGQLTARMFRHWPGNAIAVHTQTPLAKETWTHVAVTYDGSSRASGLQVYVGGKPAEVEILRDRLYKGTGQHTLVFGQRFRDRGFKGGRIDDLFIFARALTPPEVAQLGDGRSLADALAKPQAYEAGLREYFFSAIDEATRRAASRLAAARGRVVAAEDAQFEVPVMEEMPQPRPAYVLARGRYDAPRSESSRVERGVPASLLPFPSGLRRDRLGLAQWLTRPDHPLTARVAVNRIWTLLFGRGLVETVENFGLQGQLPTHPELLDWLAVVFSQPAACSERAGEQRGRGAEENQSAIPSAPLLPRPSATGTEGLGWNVKALVKLIVLSSTYRQASALQPELRRRDPENRLLARGPSGRLSGEMIRDLALAASGLLDARLGGPPVSPYQPGDLWRESNTMSPAYRQSVGRDLYRRSLYTVWKRTVPMPNMVAFDAPSREVCVARRQATNTPLQAFVLLNDPQFVEAARALAERALREGGTTPAERVRFTFLRLATREPTGDEAKLLVALYEQQRALFGQEPEAAAKLIRIGASQPDPGLSPVDLAAATVVAQAILNMDATIWKR